MITSDSLFDLIHSLTKEQKRQFRIYAKKYDRDSKYLTLFDLLSKQHDYDPLLIKTKWQGLFPSSRLAVSKEYLTELILKSLRDAVPTGPEQLSLQLLQDIRNLLDRRLYSLAKKRIAKADQIVSDYDLVGAKFILIALESYLPDRRREEIFEKESHLMEETKQIVELGVFAETFRTFSEEKGQIRSEEDMKILSRMIEHSPHPDPSTLTTFSAKLRYYFVQFKYCQLTCNTDGMFESLRQIIQLYDEHPLRAQTQQLEYISFIMNLCSMELYHGDGNKIEPYILRIQSLRINGQVRPYFDLMFYHFNVEKSIVTQNWNELDRLHSELSLMIARNSEANSFGKDIRIDFYLLFAQAYFLRGKFELTLAELNQLFMLQSLKEHDFQAHNARLLLLMTHYELGNLQYLPYLIRSTYRSFLRRGRLDPFEASILKFLSSLTKITTRQNLRKTLQQLLKDLIALSSDNREFRWKKFYLKWIEKTIGTLGGT